MTTTDDHAEELRKRHGKIAIIGESSGWHVQFEHQEQTDSVGEPVKMQWRPLTGIVLTIEEAVELANMSRPKQEEAVATS